MAKNNNTLVFNGLMQGMSWDLIKEAKEEIQRHLGEKQPTKKDILTDWIIDKDYMLQLQGNSYLEGGFTGIDWKSGNFKYAGENGESTIGNTNWLGATSSALLLVGDAFSGYNDIENTKDLFNTLLNQFQNQRFNIGDNALLASEWNNRMLLGDAPTREQFGYKNGWKVGLNALLNGLTTAGTTGNVFLGLGAAGLSAIKDLWLNSEAKEALEEALTRYNIAQDQLPNLFNYSVDLALHINTFNQLQNIAKSGGKLKKSHKFAKGGLLNTYDFGLEEINAGGSHEENPNEGVVVSYAPDGLPNKVEEGETIHNDYVYSKRLEANLKVLKNNLLDEKYKGKSFADISKKLTEDRKQRPNDPISVRTNEENLNRLQGALEELKLDNKTKEVKRFLGSLNNDLLNALQLEMMEEYEAYAEQLAQQLEQEDLAYQEEQAALEGMFGRGGHLFLTKGKIKYLGEDVPYYNEDINSAYYTGANPTTFRYYKSEDSKNYYTSLFNLGWNIGDATTIPYGKDNNITFTDINSDNIEGGVPVLNGKRMSNEEQRNLVKRILNDLVGLGYDIKIDGLYGPKTMTAILHLAKLNLEYEQWYNSRKEKGLPAYPYNYYVDFIQNGGNLISSIPVLPPLETKEDGEREKRIKLSYDNNITSSLPKKAIPKVSRIPKIKVDTEGKVSSSLAPLRFAEAFGSAGLYLSDILGLSNQPDYSNARMYQRAIDNIGGVNFTPIGNYLTYTPIDTEYLTNQLMATAAAKRNYGNVAGNYTLGLLDDYNTLNQIGATAIAARQQDLEQKNKVAEFNRTTNAKNSEMSLDAQKQNAALRELRALEYKYLADMMTKERDTNEAAKAANYQNFMSNLAAIGREDYNYDFIRWAAQNGLLKPGALKNYPGLFGYLNV